MARHETPSGIDSINLFAEIALPLPLNTLFTYRVPEKFQSSAKVGQTVLVPFRNRLLKGTITHLSNQNGSETSKGNVTLKEIQNLFDPEFVLPDSLLKLTRWVSERYACSWGEALALCSQPVKKVKNPFVDPLASDQDVDSAPRFELAPEQISAIRSVNQSIQEGKHEIFLLYGVTSSGKTEVYLNAIEETIKRNKQAIYLVPEISLCAPFFEIIKKRFGDRAGVWHSQIRGTEKKILLEKIKNGTVDIVLGARSALFVPFGRLGTIILDEEHDHSYKQSEKPRYHARETALKLAEIVQGIAIFGSATPSLESFYRSQKGEYTLLELPNRVPNQVSPRALVIDRKSTASKKSALTPLLIDAINKALLRREQVILALNRRGYSTFLLCSNCGFVWQCENCQLALVYHDEDHDTGKGLFCHYCFFKMELPSVCGQCGSLYLIFGGYGTQKIAQELKKLFPYARVLRLDKDTARKKSVPREIYHKFKDESADILVGTQMVVQGFDFPRVTLVGVVDADTALYHPDFRSGERTFQWIAQSAGRAGRSSLGGQVVIQTSLPDHYTLQTACNLDYRAFYEKEIEFRKELFYPPFAQLVLFRFQSAKKREQVMEEAERFTGMIKSKLNSLEGLQILGPGPSPKEKLRKLFRWQTLVNCADGHVLERVVECARQFSVRAPVRFAIDVDPYDIL